MKDLLVCQTTDACFREAATVGFMLPTQPVWVWFSAFPIISFRFYNGVPSAVDGATCLCCYPAPFFPSQKHFYANLNTPFFIWDMCCHLALCLHQIEPNFTSKGRSDMSTSSMSESSPDKFFRSCLPNWSKLPGPDVHAGTGCPGWGPSCSQWSSPPPSWKKNR